MDPPYVFRAMPLHVAITGKDGLQSGVELFEP
jgi:hypothetical protein